MQEFILIQWPEVQDFFDVEGFSQNSSLLNDYPLLDEFGDSAYFVRKSWLEEHHQL